MRAKNVIEPWRMRSKPKSSSVLRNLREETRNCVSFRGGSWRSQDVERRHIARELHDSAGQTLAALGLQLAQISEDAKKDPARLQNVQNAEELVQHLTRGNTHDLLSSASAAVG